MNDHGIGESQIDFAVRTKTQALPSTQKEDAELHEETQ